MSKLKNYLMEQAEALDMDMSEMLEKERELAHLEWEQENNQKRIYELEVELGKREPIEKVDFLASFPQYKNNTQQKYIDDPDRAYEEWVDAKVERGEY